MVPLLWLKDAVSGSVVAIADDDEPKRLVALLSWLKVPMADPPRVRPAPVAGRWLRCR